jgi:zinc protease
MGVTLNDVKDYYQRTYRPDLTTIVVIGNINPEAAETTIKQHFLVWQNSGPKPETDFPTISPNKSSSASVPDAQRVQDDVTLAESLNMNRFNPDYYALELGNHVLGGGFATRYYRDLREKGGLVYTVGSTFNIGKTRGIYEVSYGCDPPNVSKAHQIVARDLHDMQTAPASQQEIDQAKALLLREIPLAESSVDAIAGGFLARSLIGLPIDEPTQAALRYMALKPEDVRAAFAKWIRPDDLVQITEGPAPQ